MCACVRASGSLCLSASCYNMPTSQNVTIFPSFADTADSDECTKALHPYLPRFLACVKVHGRDSTSSKLDLAKQNDLLLEAIFDATGTLLYHEACVLRIFGISKGRLRRIQERRMGLRDNHHGLVGVCRASFGCGIVSMGSTGQICHNRIRPSCAFVLCVWLQSFAYVF